MTPEELKKVRRKVILLLCLIGAVPVLSIVLLLMLYAKGYLGGKPSKPKVRQVENDFMLGERLFRAASPHYEKANSLYGQNQRSAAYAEYKLCEKDYEEALVKIRKWSEGKDLSEYSNVETCMRQINIELRAVRERMLMIEASGDAGGPRPPAPPPPPAQAPAEAPTESAPAQTESSATTDNGANP